MEYTIQQKSATFAIERLAVPIGVRLALYVEVKNWFLFAPQAALSGLFTAMSELPPYGHSLLVD